MKTIGFIPARCGSKEIPLKNIKLLCGKPLIYWTLKSLSLSTKIDEIILATDCEQIASITVKLQIPKVNVFMRSLESATDEASTEMVMLEYLHNSNLNEEDLIVLIQATSPYTTNNDITNALNQLTDSSADSLLSCARTHHFYWNEQGQPINYDSQKRPRRQEFKGNLQENGAIYINRVKNILQDQNRLSGEVSVYEMPDYTTVELDKAYQWEIAEAIMRNFNLDKR